MTAFIGLRKRTADDNKFLRYCILGAGGDGSEDLQGLVGIA
jgi:hypothetical protein